MSDHVMVWHMPTAGTPTATYYADRDYVPVALRIHAGRAPGGNLKVDVLDDGISVLRAHDTQTVTLKQEDAYIEYHGVSGAFRLGETISGTTTSASGVIKESKIGELVLQAVKSPGFKAGETITGASSAATATVSAFVRQVQEHSKGTVAGESYAVLFAKHDSDQDAGTFRDGSEIREGSWVSLSLLDAAGAQNITVQLELDAVAVSNENRPVRDGAK